MDDALRELAAAARLHLEGGRYRKAEYLLWEILRQAPRAPRSTYLLGVSLLLQRRFPDARRLIDRAYTLRPGVVDQFDAPDRGAVLREAIETVPDWHWLRYQLAQEGDRVAESPPRTGGAEPPNPIRRLSPAFRTRRVLRGAARRLCSSVLSDRLPRARGQRASLTDKEILDLRLKEARQHLSLGHPDHAEQILRAVLRVTPKAPTVRFLAGVAALLQGRFEDARRRIDPVYLRRPWIDDRIAAPMVLEVLEDARRALPEWEWPIYQIARERWRAVGLSVEAAANHLTSVKGDRPTFVQVGANDGMSGDPLFRLIRRRALRGLLVEPQAEPFARLETNYRDVEGLAFENAAVTDVEGPVEMVTATSRTTIGSITPDRTILHLHDGELRTVTVTGKRFDSIVAQHGLERFDLLQIDTEGFDYQVLRQVDLRGRGIAIVNLEYFCLPVTERLAVCEHLDAAGFALQFSRRDVLGVDRSLFADPFCITDIC